MLGLEALDFCALFGALPLRTNDLPLFDINHANIANNLRLVVGAANNPVPARLL